MTTLESKLNCIHCGSANTKKNGFLKHSKRQDNYCKDCKKRFSGFGDIPGAPKILLFDLETSHILARIWDTGDQYVRPDQITSSEYILCWSAKWLFGDTVSEEYVTPKESLLRDDKRIVVKLHKLLSEADIVITQNGDKFDIRKIQWKFLKYGLAPNNKYHSIDTLKKSRQLFDPISHGLDNVARDLGFGEKSPTTEQDWFDAEAGDKKALEKLSKYCTNDIYLLEDWYLLLRPWMKTHPNLAPYIDMYRELENDETTCPRCLNVLHVGVFNKKWYSMATGKQYQSGACGHCGTQLRISKEKEEDKLDLLIDSMNELLEK